MLKFENSDVAQKYKSSFVGDPVIHLPGGKTGNGFRKKLSTLTMEEADRLYANQGQNLLSLSNGTVPPASAGKGKESKAGDKTGDT